MAGGREYSLRNFMTHCVRMQNGARGPLSSHEPPLFPTIQTDKDGSWWDPLGTGAPRCSASLLSIQHP